MKNYQNCRREDGRFEARLYASTELDANGNPDALDLLAQFQSTVTCWRTDGQPYSCAECDRSFVNWDNFLSHLEQS